MSRLDHNSKAWQNPLVNMHQPTSYEDTTMATSASPFGAINEKQRRYGMNHPFTPSSMSHSRNIDNNDDNDDSLFHDKNKVRKEDTWSNYNPFRVRSHLYHALEGLHRYPNYLSRWNNDNDIQRLEDTLTYYQNLIQSERQRIHRFRNNIINPIIEQLKENDNNDDYSMIYKTPDSWEEIKERILHPDIVRTLLNTTKVKDTLSHTSVQDVLDGKISLSYDVGSLTEIMNEEIYDVFSIPLLRPEFCQLLQSYIIDFIRISQELEVNDSTTNNPSSDNKSINNDRLLLLRNRPVDLDMIGLGWINSLLFYLIMQPISRHLYQSSETIEELDWRQGYVAGYSVTPTITTPRTNLATHTDDSEVTMNICLSSEHDFDGGRLEFYGLRGMKTSLIGTYQPTIGESILHAGRHFHHVTTVTSGYRFVYILWARSWKGIRAQSCPCCWLNRRTDQSCICSPKWN